MNTGITDIHAREILDSRGNPTVETTVTLEGGATGTAAVPSGASTGRYEAVELRDGDRARYGGRGVLHALASVNGEISALLRGFDARAQLPLDRALCELDGTENKSRLGANAILSVSLAAAKAAAASEGVPLWRYLGGQTADTLPVPLLNVLNGGVHAANPLDVQEFMLVPVGAPCFREALRMGAEVYHELGTLVGRCGVGDEGGYAPMLETSAQALELLMRAVERAGYRVGEDIFFALDAAASEWYDAAEGTYRLPKSGRRLTRGELSEEWRTLATRFPLLSLEDGAGEDDDALWRSLTETLGERLQLVGDDLFVTDASRIARGAREKLANAALIKPNQIGTLTETVEAVRAAQSVGWAAVLSHRSGETEDAILADLAVGLGCPQLKAGAPCRGERTAKYNRLLAIEEALGGNARYAGAAAFRALR